MLEYQQLSEENYNEVLRIKHELFPESNSDEDYVKQNMLKFPQINKKTDNENDKILESQLRNVISNR